jgi:tetratricopeptide (TPR) repeat protein
MGVPTIAMSLIARDEEANIERCFDSFWPHVDEVVLVDTGSKDDTVAAAKRYAASHNEAHKLTVGEFEWIDDFAAARNYADSLCTADWIAWCDLDDVIAGAEHLRELAASAQPGLNGYVVGYDYAHDPHGNVLCYLIRERLVRRGTSTWLGAIHEAQRVEGAMTRADNGACRWIHRPNVADSSKRNLRILRKWVKREPDDPRARAYLGTEELVAGRMTKAKTHFRRYLKMKTGWDEERAQVHRKYAICLMADGRYEEAIKLAFEAIELLPGWTDSYLTLAEAYHQTGQFVKAAEWAQEALRRGQPDTLLIVNPLEYTFSPRMLLASALGGMARIDEAIAVAEEALKIVPDHAHLQHGYAQWRQQRKRNATAETWVGAAQMLIAHDEQLKALRLIEDTCPHFIADHPAVVEVRSQLRQRMAELLEPARYAQHYRDRDEPDELVPDAQVDVVAGSLPRSRFLFEGLQEQLGPA